MSDRALLFLFSILVIVVCLGTCGALLMNGQAETVDGLFLILMCLSIALAFVIFGSGYGIRAIQDHGWKSAHGRGSSNRPWPPSTKRPPSPRTTQPLGEGRVARLGQRI